MTELPNEGKEKTAIDNWINERQEGVVEEE